MAKDIYSKQGPLTDFGRDASDVAREFAKKWIKKYGKGMTTHQLRHLWLAWQTCANLEFTFEILRRNQFKDTKPRSTKRKAN